jgi:hypothetical protein
MPQLSRWRPLWRFRSRCHPRAPGLASDPTNSLDTQWNQTPMMKVALHVATSPLSGLLQESHSRLRGCCFADPMQIVT